MGVGLLLSEVTQEDCGRDEHEDDGEKGRDEYAHKVHGFALARGIRTDGQRSFRRALDCIHQRRSSHTKQVYYAHRL